MSVLPPQGSALIQPAQGVLTCTPATPPLLACSEWLAELHPFFFETWRHSGLSSLAAMSFHLSLWIPPCHPSLPVPVSLPLVRLPQAAKDFPLTLCLFQTGLLKYCVVQEGEETVRAVPPPPPPPRAAESSHKGSSAQPFTNSLWRISLDDTVLVSLGCHKKYSNIDWVAYKWQKYNSRSSGG